MKLMPTIRDVLWRPYDISYYDLGCMRSRSRAKWYGCRDTFDFRHPKLTRLLFRTRKPKEVVAFVNRAQDILGLAGDDCAELSETNLEDIVFVRLGKFWRQGIRRSLFTILLRAGNNYDLKTRGFWKAAEESPYLWTTRYAFRRFMSGHTKFVRRGVYKRGWVDTFGNICPLKVDARLRA